jgi:hypothetical protein
MKPRLIENRSFGLSMLARARAWAAHGRANLRLVLTSIFDVLWLRAALPPAGGGESSSHAAASRRNIHLLFFMVLALLCLYCASAFAGDGDTFVTKLKEWWYGAPGFILGVIILAVAVIGFLSNGIGWMSIVAAMAGVFFMIPGIVTGIQAFAKSWAGA